MCVFIWMLCECGGVTVVTKGAFVFIVSHCEISSCLSNINGRGDPLR